MFVANEGQQITLSDSTNHLTDREQKTLEKPWTIPFAKRIFPVIDEKLFSVLYSDKDESPGTTVHLRIKHGQPLSRG